ncbi:MAG: radical SAM protein [Elusimicrobia bacterium]|nr:radical SAM protein [Elusimicrobiota bacterium]
MGLRNWKSSLQLFVTRRCQLRCRYCAVIKGGEDMTPATALKGVDLLLGSRSEELTLEFYGGEPLLAFDVIREATEHAARRGRSLGKRLRFHIATNALLLDDRKLEWMARHGFLVVLSWDGAPRTHNLERVAGGGGLDTYEVLRRKVEKVLLSGVTCSVIPVATPASVKALDRNLEHLLAHGVRSFDLNYSIGVEWPRRAQDDYFAQMLRFAGRHRRELAAGEIRIGNLRGDVEPGVINPEFTVDTDGTIRLLTEWLMECVPPGAPTPRPLGSVHDAPAYDSLYINRFHCARAHFAMYAGNPGQRRVILNNIAFGRRYGEFFMGLRRWISKAAPRRRADEPEPPREIRAYAP